MPGKRLEIGLQSSASTQPRSLTWTQAVAKNGSEALRAHFWSGEVRAGIDVTSQAGLPWPPCLRKCHLVILCCCTWFISFLGFIAVGN